MIDDDNFMSRWSRRKIQARREAEGAESAPLPTDPTNDGAQPDASTDLSAIEPARNSSPAELPPVDSLQGLESEYGDFLKPDVPEGTQRAALKKLFADPHFNQMDRLDVYIDDYNQFEPMSAAVAATLQAAGRLSVFDHLESEQRLRAEKKLNAEPAATTAAEIETTAEAIDSPESEVLAMNADRANDLPEVEPHAAQNVESKKTPQ